MTMSELHLQQEQFTNAKRWLKVQGILSIIFGALGTLFAAPLAFFYSIGITAELATEMPGLESEIGPVVFIIVLIVGLILWLIPHLFLIVSGALLARGPKPGVAKGLTITNLIIGAMWNYLILAFAIVSLVQSGNYARGYVHHKK